MVCRYEVRLKRSGRKWFEADQKIILSLWEPVDLQMMMRKEEEAVEDNTSDKQTKWWRRTLDGQREVGTVERVKEEGKAREDRGQIGGILIWEGPNGDF